MKTVLITGANRGIGLEFVTQYLARGDRVIACCRVPASAAELQQMASPELQILALDVSDSTAISALPAQLDGLEIDLFINNAGTYGAGQSLQEADREDWLRVFNINTIAPLLLTRAVLPLMSTNPAGKLVYLSSKMGSIADNSGGGTYIYRSSKTALNAVVKSLAIDLAPRWHAVAALHPGWVLTDMGGPNALIDTKTSVSGLMQVIDGLSPDNSGKFYNYDGSEIPW